MCVMSGLYFHSTSVFDWHECPENNFYHQTSLQITQPFCDIDYLGRYLFITLLCLHIYISFEKPF